MICFGALIVHVLTVGQQNIAGVIYSELVDEFDTSRAESGNTPHVVKKKKTLHYQESMLIFIYDNCLDIRKNYIGRSASFLMSDTRARTYYRPGNPRLSKVFKIKFERSIELLKLNSAGYNI